MNSFSRGIRPLTVGVRSQFFSKNAAFSSEIGKDKSALIYKIQSHRVKPKDQQNYLDLLDEHILNLHKDENLPQTLVGSFQVTFGTEDEVIHIWKYSGGYAALQKSEFNVEANLKYREYREERRKLLRSRQNQLLVQFDHMPDPIPRTGNSSYEMRSYKLKSGSIGEWHYNWANIGLKCRSQDEVVTGFFTNAGPLNLVHHLWCYKDLKDREETRSRAWHHPAWATHVRNTTPLIKSFETKLMVPLPWSPLQ